MRVYGVEPDGKFEEFHMRSAPKRMGQCAYCGKRRLVTGDHIPPKCLFPEPRASNLITVPCCETCRKGWSKDDEYFRAAILCSDKVSDRPLAQGVMDPFFRSVARSPGFAELLIGKIKEIEIVTEAGIYLGEGDALELDVGRIDRVAQRIIRGLFFREKEHPLPEHYQVIARIQQFGVKPVLDKLQGITFPELRIVQDGVFCYTFHDTAEDPDSGVWLLLFYKNLPLVGFTRPHA